MNIFDIMIILLILMSAITGMKRGFLKELVMLVGIIVVYIISFKLKGVIGITLCKVLPFFNFDGLVTFNILIYQLIAFVIIASVLFSIYNIILKLTGVIQKIVDLTIILTIPSKILGFIVGLIEGYIMLFIILLIISVPLKDNMLLLNSKLSGKIINETPILGATLGNLDELVIDIQEVTEKVNKKNVSSTNLKLLDMYLDYNIIKKEDLNEVISTGKLDDVQGIKKYKNRRCN